MNAITPAPQKQRLLEALAQVHVGAPENQAARDALVAQATAWNEREQNPRDVMLLTLAVMRYVRGVAPNDFEVQLQSAGTLVQGSQVAAELGLDPVSILEEAQTWAASLVARFPDKAKAHGLLAQVYVVSGAEPLAILRSLRECAKLDSTDSVCKNEYERIAGEYAKPRCIGNKIQPELKLFRILRSGTGPTVRIDGDLFPIDDEPIVGADGFESIYQADEKTVMLQLSKSGQERVARTTVGAGDEDIPVVIMVGPTVVAGGAFRPGPSPPGIAIGAPLKSLCTYVEQDALPAELPATL